MSFPDYNKCIADVVLAQTARKERYTGVLSVHVDRLSEHVMQLVSACRRLDEPYILGWETVRRVAAEGQCVLAGRAFIAASDLYDDGCIPIRLPRPPRPEGVEL